MLPATNEFTPLVLEIARFADRVLVNVQLESLLAGGLITALRVLPTTVIEVGVITALVSSFKQVIAVMYFVRLVWETNEVSIPYAVA